LRSIARSYNVGAATIFETTTMRLFGHPLTELEERDLIALKEGGQAERKTLGYKRDGVGQAVGQW
jgi:hypothetical protein